MKKRILLIRNSPELAGIGEYNGEIEWFVNQDEEKTNIKSNDKLKIIRCPLYVPEDSRDLKRILLDLSFQISALFPLIGFILRRKFEFIVSLVQSFRQGLLGQMYKKIRGGKLIDHIQDMQIDAAKDLDMINSSVLINFLSKIEKTFFNQSANMHPTKSLMLK